MREPYKYEKPMAIQMLASATEIRESDLRHGSLSRPGVKEVTRIPENNTTTLFGKSSDSIHSCNILEFKTH